MVMHTESPFRRTSWGHIKNKVGALLLIKEDHEAFSLGIIIHCLARL